MKSMKDNSIDFIVTDPPYGLNFMGKDWDKSIPNVEIWKEALRICKPGSMLAAFGGSRTHHHLMIALEKSGWEIRDVIMWLYGQGFPKSHNNFGLEGYGTALKPAYEPIILAMKPLEGTFAQNAEKWGIGGINIDGSRIQYNGEKPSSFFYEKERKNVGFKLSSGNKKITSTPDKGRWPANIILDEESAEMLDEQSGITISKKNKKNDQRYEGNLWKKGNRTHENSYNDSGGASRFFYCAKASASERNKGLEGMPLKEKKTMNSFSNNCEFDPTKTQNKCDSPQKNFHPTVKPIALMKYIIKLLAPPGNPTLLDPFAGSGSTLIAAKELGINAIGIEKEQEYCEIANKRIENTIIDQKQMDLFNEKYNSNNNDSNFFDFMHS